ncbi:efflux RND transporter periplasmic adaptor subunit [Paraburkholderia caribensis]|uniref:efflux RND transporter periplasmic adaptor subunit n=1 Tax=Paraburkholderia caribensis TaxID=75105 RepID=UPI001CB01A9F|nr:efflux RND transporter periplasmic adaptor subunit [Paraburkholderia caribensis]CAG9243737.1 Membrane fusion protein, multidrug efflux system [Paraburkholderia caribensis]
MSSNSNTPLSRKRVLLIATTAVAIAGCGLFLGTRASSAPHASGADASAPQVTVAVTKGYMVDDRHVFTGRLQAVDTIEVRPRVSGYVTDVRFKEGALVHKGDVLFVIDPRPYRAEVDRLTADLTQSKAEATQAQSNADRGRRLLSQSAIAQEAAEQLDTTAKTSRSRSASIQAQLEAAALNLGFTEVRAPIDGRVSYAMITAGNLVTPDSVLTRVVSVDPIYGYFDIDEQSYLALQRMRGDGHTVPAIDMALANESDFTHTGKLDFVDNQLDAGSGTIRLRAVFPNRDGKFTPGLYAQVRLQQSQPVQRVLLNDSAVGTDLGNQFVYVIDAENKVVYRKVTTGPMFDGLRVIGAGVNAGERVVVDGLQHVQPGMAVKPVPVATGADLTAQQKSELAKAERPAADRTSAVASR